jgi:ABC-type multidrug transport system fused ATPase/permease subunit
VSKRGTSTGEIVSIFSTDTKTISAFLFVINQFVMALPTILISLYLIHNMVGSAVFAAMAMVAIGFPINVGAMNFIKQCRKQKLSKSDVRTKLMNEILNGVRIIKYYGWESAFKGKVLSVREDELRFVRRIAYTVAVFFTVSLQGVPVFLPVVTFYTFVKLGGVLTTATAFTVLGYMNIMSFPFIFLPLGKLCYTKFAGKFIILLLLMVDFWFNVCCFRAHKLHKYVSFIIANSQISKTTGAGELRS